MLPVPAIVAIENKHPPLSFISITSVQRSCEEIIPMCALGMLWRVNVPNSSLGHGQLKSRVHVLKCALYRSR